MKITEIIISSKALKELRKLPIEIIDSLDYWIKTVKAIGIYEVRKISGYHDEPLSGDRKGQRSIKLNRSYRAFYTVDKDEAIVITVVEVNKHKY